MKKKIKTIKGIDVSGKRVIFRTAYDFTLKKRGGSFVVPDDIRIKTTIPTLRYLLKKKAKVIILTWLGRPKKREKRFKLDPVARRLSQLIKRPVKKLNESVGPKVEKEIAKMKPGEIIMLENIRFETGEQKASKQLAKKLSRLGDVVVNDAFAQIHRRAASLALLQKHLPSYSGFLLCSELEELTSLFCKPRKPRLAIIGGVKVSTRLELIKRLTNDFEYILLGGALANTIFKAQGHTVGRSLFEEEMVDILRSKAFLKNNVIIPIDVIVTSSNKKISSKIRAVGNVGNHEIIYDIGPDTIELFKKYIRSAKTIVWNGPMGLCEVAMFNKGTKSIAQTIAKTRARSIIGGGDTISAVKKAGLVNQYDFISTGGGAMLHFLEGKTLPGLKYLKREK
ncbi:phosphoglycerate kinase [Patescibacteria group bacterium]